MKRISRFAAVVIALALVLLTVTSCRSNDQKIYDKVYAYLNEKYPGVEFEILGYTQDSETSGKYTFRVKCHTTGLEFEVMMTSLLISDSYLVVHANYNLRNQIYEILGSARELICLEDVQCFDHYHESDGAYRFNEDVELTSYTVLEIDSIYRVVLEGTESSGDVAQCVYMFCDILDNNGVALNEVTFDFLLNGEKILFTTSTNTIEGLESFEPLEELFEKAKSPSELNTLFYKDPDSDTKIITYITD